jgi:hypothetical protein
MFNLIHAEFLGIPPPSYFTVFALYYVKKSKAIHITDRGGLKGCEMLRIPQCLDNRLTDGGKVVGLTHQPHFTPHKFFFLMFLVLISVT